MLRAVGAEGRVLNAQENVEQDNRMKAAPGTRKEFQKTRRREVWTERKFGIKRLQKRRALKYGASVCGPRGGDMSLRG